VSAARPAAEHYRPRGIGVGYAPCFVCGVDGLTCPHDLAAFVDDKAAGERVVALFRAEGGYAVLDYRDFEPNWVQVKVGACVAHVPQLERLYASTADVCAITDTLLRKLLHQAAPDKDALEGAGHRHTATDQQDR
jgi:hypothetical protein